MALKEKPKAGSGTRVDFAKIGDKLEGYYCGSFPFEGDYGPTKIHQFKNDKGLFSVFGQKQLMDDLSEDMVGCWTVLVYEKDIPSKKKGFKAMKSFKILFDDEDVVDVSAVAAAAESDASEPEEATEEYADESVETQEEESQEEQAPVQQTRRPTQQLNSKPLGKPVGSTLSPEQKARSQALLGKRS